MPAMSFNKTQILTLLLFLFAEAAEVTEKWTVSNVLYVLWSLLSFWIIQIGFQFGRAECKVAVQRGLKLKVIIRVWKTLKPFIDLLYNNSLLSHTDWPIHRRFFSAGYVSAPSIKHIFNPLCRHYICRRGWWMNKYPIHGLNYYIPPSHPPYILTHSRQFPSPFSLHPSAASFIFNPETCLMCDADGHAIQLKRDGLLTDWFRELKVELLFILPVKLIQVDRNTCQKQRNCSRSLELCQ